MARGDTGSPPPSVIVGISCDYHDAAAALVVDGRIAAAAEEERFTRIKHDNSLPENAIRACLEEAGIAPADVDAIVFHEKPLVVINRVLAARQRRGPMAIGKFVNEFPVLLRRNLMIAYRTEKAFRAMGVKRPPRLLFGEHHLSHAAAAYYPSPFESAAVLTVDGIGEWTTASIGHGTRHRLELLSEQRFPNSLGLTYSLMTDWCGFQPNDGEYKLMGLAPFGEPRYRDGVDRLVRLADDGALDVDTKLVKWWGARSSSLKKLARAFDGPPLAQRGPLTQREADLARSVQDATEDAVLAMAQHAHELTGETDLVMAGGVALNCVANGRLLREGPFERIWVQPAAGDAGSAIGAALWLWHSHHNQSRPAPAESTMTALLGPSFDEAACGAAVEAAGLVAERLDDDELLASTAAALADGEIVGWFQGRMEFGPRALGNRSILADPRSDSVQSELNLRTKGRESFRPFAPAVLADRADDWFDIAAPSPFMLFTFPVAERRRESPDSASPAERSADFEAQVAQRRSQIPACTHVDYSARVQTVDAAVNPRFAGLLERFEALTECPVLLNTSFNRAGEPIVCTPADAIATAQVAQLDRLVLGNLVVRFGADDAETATNTHRESAPV